MPAPNERLVIIGFQTSWYTFPGEETIYTYPMLTSALPHCKGGLPNSPSSPLSSLQLRQGKGTDTCGSVFSGGGGTMAAYFYACMVQLELR